MVALINRLRQWLSPSQSAATSLNPAPVHGGGDVAGHLQSGNRWLDQGRLQEAAYCYRQALAVATDSVAARVNLAYVLLQQNQHRQAAQELTVALQLADDNADAHYLSGQAAEGLGDLAAAAQAFARAVALNAELEPAWLDLGRVQLALGQTGAATATLKQAKQHHPNSSDVQAACGHLALALRDLPSAIAHYRHALQATPDHAARLHLADALQQTGDLTAAVSEYQTLLHQQPQHGLAHSGLGNALRSLGQLAAAREHGELAMTLAPQSASVQNNLGVTLAELGLFEPASAFLAQAQALAPDVATYFANGAAVLQKQGQLDAALRAYRHALALNPADLATHSNLLYAMSFSSQDTPQAYLHEAQRYGDKVTALASPLPTRPPSQAPAPLRIGFVSGDLRSHPVAYFLENVLAALLDKSVHLFAYASSPRFDAISERLQPLFRSWRPIHQLSDEAAARLIHDDAVDLLIDLSGHTAYNRLALFAWRPAPVALSWLGWFASTGVQQMDYILVDPVSVPAALREQFTERLAFLPHSRFCFTPPSGAQLWPVSELPALRNGHLTFAVFQNFSKIDHDVLRAWAAIARQLPGAVFRLQNEQLNTVSARQACLLTLRQAGLDPARVQLHGASHRGEYLKAYQEVDIALDTFVFNGATTTCEALWMGVPTMTLAGQRLVSRQGASLLQCMGLAQWVAQSPEDYVAGCVQHAQALTSLAELRRGLRERFLQSPLCDAGSFADDLLTVLSSLVRGTPGEAPAS